MGTALTDGLASSIETLTSAISHLIVHLNILLSEPCSCGARLYQRYDKRYVRWFYQHGENPEHVMFIDAIAMGDIAAVKVDVAAWCERIHESEATPWQLR